MTKAVKIVDDTLGVSQTAWRGVPSTCILRSPKFSVTPHFPLQWESTDSGNFHLLKVRITPLVISYSELKDGRLITLVLKEIKRNLITTSPGAPFLGDHYL